MRQKRVKVRGRVLRFLLSFRLIRLGVDVNAFVLRHMVDGLRLETAGFRPLNSPVR
jgi:hypothetical protein